MAYATLAELKAYVGIPTADVTDDTLLTLALNTASDQVDWYCDRTFTADATVTTRDYWVTTPAYLDVEPISTTTGLIVQTDDNNDGIFETTWVLGTDFRLEPINAVAAGVPWDRIVGLGNRYFPKLAYRPGVRVTAKFGWPGGTPEAVKQATLLLASKVFKRKDSPFGIAGSPEVGSELRILAGDKDAERLLRPYRRLWWIAG